MTTDQPAIPAPPRRLRYPVLIEMIILGGLGSIWGSLFGAALDDPDPAYRFAADALAADALSTALYVGMGWMVVVAIQPMLERLSGATLAWLVAGGIFIAVLVVTAWLAAVVALAVWLLGPIVKAAGFDIGQSVIDYSREASYGRALAEAGHRAPVRPDDRLPHRSAPGGTRHGRTG